MINMFVRLALILLLSITLSPCLALRFPRLVQTCTRTLFQNNHNPTYFSLSASADDTGGWGGRKPSTGKCPLTRLKPFVPLISWYVLASLPIYGIGLPFFGSMTDFDKLQNRNMPGQVTNEYIVAPSENFTPRARIDDLAPQYKVSADALQATVSKVMSKQPRITFIAEDPTTRRLEYVQRTPLFQFPDCITIQAVPITTESSSLAIHSASVYGAGDLGVNKARVLNILNEISQEIQGKE